jgi:hypothetical protein
MKWFLALLCAVGMYVALASAPRYGVTFFHQTFIPGTSIAWGWAAVLAAAVAGFLLGKK